MIVKLVRGDMTKDERSDDEDEGEEHQIESKREN